MSQHYRAVTASTPEQLNEAIEKLLNAGWWLQGGVSVGAARIFHGDKHDTVVRTYAQAMWLLKANKAAAVLGSFVMNPLTSTFFWTLSIVIGSVILGEDYSTMLAKIKGDNMINGIGGAYLVFLAGNVVISSTFAVASYFIIKNAVIKRRALKEEKRLKKAGEGHAGM